MYNESKTLEKGGIMNKQDLIGKVAEVTGMQKSDSEKAVNAVFDLSLIHI